jgi:hypothetical protein
MGRLKASTVETHELKERDLDEMYALFAEFYENTEKEKFLKDLLNKPKVILLRDKLDQSIKGFSTLKFFSIKIDERTINGLFSGDTVIDTHYRGTTALTMEFFKNIMGFKLRNPFKPLYWFLITKGYKTYLLLTNNYATYYPRFNKPTPSFEKKIIDRFASELFGHLYDANAGVLKHADRYDRLRGDVAPITEDLLANPHINYFQMRNPNWQRGDELCCIGKAGISLATKYLSRVFKKRFKPILFFWSRVSGS